MQRGWIVPVDRRGLRKLIRNLGLGLAKNVAGLALAVGLRLARHGVLESLRDFHIANFHGLNHDPPGIRLLIENALQFAAQRFALGDHLREFMATDRFAQARLRAQCDRLYEVLNFEDAFLSIPDHPEHDGVDVDWHGVASERGFRRDAGHPDALVHVRTQRFKDWNDMAKAGAAQADVTTQAQDGNFLPLAHNLDREKKIEADQ